MPLSLSTEQQQLFERSLQIIEKVAGLFVEAQTLFPEFAPDIVGIKQQLTNPFSIFICGEFNSGKSSLLNQLGDDSIAPVGILPTTKNIESYNPEGLGGLVFIDSPGTNSIIEQHQEITENYLKQADIILFVSSVERPLSKSEQDFLTLVDRTWSRKVIIIINKIDLISSEQINEVTNYISAGLKDIFKELPPLFTISAQTGQGIDLLKNFLLEFLAETEKTKLKLQGPQNSLLVYLEQLEQKNQGIQTKLTAEKTILDRTLRRIQERLEEYKMLFGIFQGNIDELFRVLLQAVFKVVDQKVAFFSVAKKRLTNEEDALEDKLTKAIQEVQLDDNLKNIFQEATTTFLTYRNRIIREATEDVETAIEIGGDKFSIPTLDSSQVNIQEMSEKIKLAADRGLNNFGKLGAVAAVTGFGGQMLFTAASVDASAFVLAVLFGLLGINALPRERQKVKAQIEASFAELKQNYINTLWKSLATELNDCLKQFIDVIQPQQQQLESQIKLSQSITEKVATIRAEINGILQELNEL
ncbi:MAG TPA: dynamin family protein [Xenococcaceae cyanobacterium]|jgi:small GTP-binding protein